MSIRIRVIFSVAAIVSAQLALAGVKPVYSLVSPGATPLYMPVRSEAVEPVHAAWAVTNAFVAPSAGFYNYGATQETNKSDRTTNLSAPVQISSMTWSISSAPRYTLFAVIASNVSATAIILP